MKQTHIGGQAVIEGVMMRGKKIYTLAVRQPDNEIYIEKQYLKLLSKKYPIFNLPILRGMVSFFESLVIGTKILSKSTEIAMADDEEEQEKSKFDEFIDKKFGDKSNDILIYVSVVISTLLGIGLFMILPMFIGNFINNFIGIKSFVILSLLEGVIRISIFLSYLYLVSRSKEIRKVFMYHGAEHKTISCFEHDEPLTVANVRKHTRLHKRCGTSFLLIVMVVSIVVFSFLKTDTIYLRVLSRIFLVPIVAGISYEIIRWAGRSESKFVELISKPGLMLQNLTTQEPTDAQIEVAIAAMKGVLESEGYK